MVLYNRFINPLKKIVCLSSLCFCDDSVDCDISPAYQIFWNPVPMILSKQNLSNNKTSFWSHWCFLTIFTSNETVCFGQCLDKKLDHLNFIPLRKKFSLNSSAKMNLGEGAQKNQSREQCVTVTCEWQPPRHHHTASQWNLEYLWAAKGAKQTKKHKQQEAMQT